MNINMRKVPQSPEKYTLRGGNMKKIIPLVCLFFCVQNSFAQKETSKATLLKFAGYKDDDKKVDSLIGFTTNSLTNEPKEMIETGLIMLAQSLKENDFIIHSYSNAIIGNGYRILGNSSKSLPYNQKSVDYALKSGNASLIAYSKNQMGHVYKDRENWKEALKLYSSAVIYAKKGINKKVKCWTSMNLGAVYLKINKLDSALIYLQSAYETQTNDANLPYILLSLGSVHTKLGNLQLGKTYCDMAIENAEKKQNSRYLIQAYIAMAENLNALNQPDSCLAYSKKAIEKIGSGKYFYLSIKPAKMIANIYEKSNCDSTLKYANIFQVANDSFFSKKANEQVEIMSAEYDLRQMELAASNEKEAENKKLNIQFALIALGIIIFLTLYLLLSRSFITSTQAIEFFGVLALLIVFEFLNLLLHPLLESITNHTPVFMLLALVCIASILIPIHHKLEKWATNKLIKKNKEVRLENAKKTIIKLEEEPN
jgi:tetratricopeptide (TPR) repeat protein